jgi:hypothetical protein
MGDLENEVVETGVDHLGLEELGDAQCLDPLFADAGNLDQRQLALVMMVIRERCSATSTSVTVKLSML